MGEAKRKKARMAQGEFEEQWNDIWAGVAPREEETMETPDPPRASIDGLTIRRKTDSPRVEPRSDFRLMAATMFETFVAFVDAGFTESQALVIIGKMLAAAPAPEEE